MKSYYQQRMFCTRYQITTLCFYIIHLWMYIQATIKNYLLGHTHKKKQNFFSRLRSCKRDCSVKYDFKKVCVASAVLVLQ